MTGTVRTDVSEGKEPKTKPFSMIAEIEDALTEKVKELLKPFGFKVEPFPDNPDNLTLTHPKGVALVVNKGSAYKAPENLGRAAQERTLSFEIMVVVRNLRDHQGAYPVIDALAYGLAGWKAPGAIFGTRLESDGFIDREASIWMWRLMVAIPVYVVPRPPAPEFDANIKRVAIKTETSETLEVGK